MDKEDVDRLASKLNFIPSIYNYCNRTCSISHQTSFIFENEYSYGSIQYAKTYKGAQYKNHAR